MKKQLELLENLVILKPLASEIVAQGLFKTPDNASVCRYGLTYLLYYEHALYYEEHAIYYEHARVELKTP